MFPTHKFLAAMTVLCGVFASREVCHAQDAATIGGVKVSGDSALARREHPRLLFTRTRAARRFGPGPAVRSLEWDRLGSSAG